MKTKLLLLSCLLFALTSTLSPASAADERVVDIDGQELRTKTKYYILPVIRGNGGGLKLYSGRNGSCPLDVVQEPNEVNRGLPVTFRPTNPKFIAIRVSADLNIKFSGSTSCVESTVWRIDSGDASGRVYVTTGGVLGNPGGSTISSWFKIEKLENDYKLVFCPTVCNTCRPICGDLGVIIEKSLDVWL